MPVQLSGMATVSHHMASAGSAYFGTRRTKQSETSCRFRWPLFSPALPGFQPYLRCCLPSWRLLVYLSLTCPMWACEHVSAMSPSSVSLNSFVLGILARCGCGCRRLTHAARRPAPSVRSSKPFPRRSSGCSQHRRYHIGSPCSLPVDRGDMS